jgi:uncharacterized membrane-anchored protein
MYTFKWAALLCVGLAWGTAVRADDSPTPSQAAWMAAAKVATSGPHDIPMIDQATLHLPSDAVFFPKAESNALMRVWGNSASDSLVGMVVPKDEAAQWVITVDHIAEGYVKDDDAKTWNADELLQSLKDGTDAQNKEREKMGIPALEIAGWIAKPSYDSSSHRLVWSLKLVQKGSAAGDSAGVNYNTYALGRDGYFEVNLLTDEKHVEADKTHASAVLSALEYSQGKRYADYVSGTDHVAEYGLAALVAGVAAKKLGMLALAGVFFAKFAKIIIAAIAIAGGGFFKFFRRKPDQTT